MKTIDKFSNAVNLECDDPNDPLELLDTLFTVLIRPEWKQAIFAKSTISNDNELFFTAVFEDGSGFVFVIHDGFKLWKFFEEIEYIALLVEIRNECPALFRKFIEEQCSTYPGLKESVIYLMEKMQS